MSSQSSEKRDGDKDAETGFRGGSAGAGPLASGPSFRFASIAGSPHHQLPSRSPEEVPKHESAKAPPSSLIDKALFAARSPTEDEVRGDPSLWLPRKLRTVPAFYPLEKSSRVVDDNPGEIASRVAECLRVLSVHAIYDNDAATANLHTSDNVEMHLSLWKTPASSKRDGIVVELQRRKGDSILFHRYSRRILDAAVGDMEFVTGSPDELEYVMYSKKVERLLSMKLDHGEMDEHENAIIAIEISHSLLTKDRMDARQLGLESLCLLTDPRKTGIITAVLASHVVLLGSTQGVSIPGLSGERSSGIMMDESPFQQIRQTILNLVQFSRIGEETGDDSLELEMDASAEKEHMTLLHNLALAVLANALDVIEHPERFGGDDDLEDAKPASTRVRTASSTEVANEFMMQSEDLSESEILSTLIRELGKASSNPHNATLSAKCIGSLCRASDEAKRKAKELGAKTVVATALEVGERTHLKLETECKKVVLTLERAE